MIENGKIIRFQRLKGTQYGITDGAAIFSLEGDPYGDFNIGNKLCMLKEVALLAPAEPKLIVGIGGNFLSVVKQLGNEVSPEPELFIRPGTTVIGDGGDILYPKISKQVNCGVELAIVIGKRAWEVPEEQALDYVLGYSCGIHVSAFDLVAKDNGRPARAQSHPTHNPLGPCITTGIDWKNIGLQARINGKLVHEGHTSDLIYGVPRLISYISASMILEPGDIIMAGQPGSNEIHVGDLIEAEIEGIGVIRHKVMAM